MKLFARKRNQRIINLTLAAVLVVSTLTASVPFLFSKKADAAPGVSYTTPAESQADWTVDRSVPSGGWSVDSTSGTVTLSVNQANANTSASFYQTEGVTKALPAGTDSLKGSVLVGSDWSTKSNLRVGLWGVAQDAGNTGPSYPIIEYAANVGGYTGWRVWNANDGTWHNVSAVTNVGAQNTVEIVSNFNTGNYDFYVNNTQVYSYSAEGYLTFTNVILNNFNAATNNVADNYTAVWSALQTGALTPDYSNVYVSNTGSDANYGTNPASPFQTIQKAINTVAAGGTVHIADGTYTEKLSFTKGNMTLVGASQTGTIIKPLSNEYGQGLTDEGFSGITIKQLTVSADASTSGGSAIKIHNAKNITLQNLTATGTGYLRGIDISAVDGVQLNNVKSSGFGKNGIAFTSQYATTDAYKTSSVKLTNVQSTNNGWAGIAFYSVGGGGAASDINGVTFNGSNTVTGNGQVGIYFEGGTDAGFGAHTDPGYAITGANGASVDLGSTTLNGNGFNVVNYQTKSVYATSAIVNGAVGNSMTAAQIQAAEASVIDHNDFDSYGDVIFDTVAPVVAITNPADSASLKGSVNVTGTVTDTDPSVSFLYITNSANQIVLQQNVNTGLTNPSLNWNTSDFADGAYTVHLEAKDAAGNEDATVSVKTIQVIIDNTAPTITVKTGASFTTGSNNTYSKVSFSLHDANKVTKYTINGTVHNVTPNAYSDANFITVGNGGAVYGNNTIVLYDAAGNTTSYNFVLDNVGPTVTVKNTSNGTNGSYKNVDFKLYDAYKVASYSVNGGAVHTLTPNTYSDANDISVGNNGGVYGSNTIVVTDVAGNQTSYNFVLDNIAPTAQLVFPARGPSATSFNVVYSEAVSATDATNPANYFLTNWPGAGGSGDLTGHAVVTYDATSNTATVSFTTPGWYVSGEQLWGVANVHDIAGNVIVTTTALSSDNLNPTAPANVATASPTKSSTNTWTWDASTDPQDVSNGASGVKGYEYQLTQHGVAADDSAWTFTTETTTTTTVSGEGAYDLHVRALDNAGNLSDESIGTVVVDTTPPTVTINGPANGATFGNGELVTITGSTGDATSYTLSIGKTGQTPVKVVTGSSFTSYDWDTTGVPSDNYIATLTGTDAAGNVSDPSEIVIGIDNTAPIVTITPQTNTNTNQPTITGTVDDVNATLVANFNGTAYDVTNNNGSFSFTAPSALQNGTYSFSIAATDPFGNVTNQSADVVVAVTAPATTPTTTVTPLITNPGAAVLGASTTNDGSTTGDTGVKGATDDKTAANSEANKGTVFGIAWYWWILILAALAAIAWFIIAAIRRRNEANS